MQKEYKITWSIEVTGETPKNAAEQALALFKAKDSTATVFRVEDHQGITTEIDLALQTENVIANNPMVIGVVIEGGIVQTIVSNQAQQLPNCMVIDYDTDGMTENDITQVVQNDGSMAAAWVYALLPAAANIDLKSLYLR